MTFVEKQRHGAHYYYYLVRSIRVSPTRVKKIRIFLGRRIPPHEELQQFFRELDRKTPRRYKPRWVSKELAERLDDLRVASLIFKQLPKTEIPIDFLVRFTYNTNAIEGNPLTLRQTALILNEGIAPNGVKAENVVEVLNGKDAWTFLRGYKGQMSSDFLCKIQYEITKNTSCRIQGHFRDTQVRIIGSEWKPPEPVKVPTLIETMIGEYKPLKHGLHPVELAAWLHNKIAQIHPFSDGNGRTARLVMNWILMKNGFPPVIIDVRNKEQYYKMIEEADKGDHKPFAVFLAQQMLEQYTARAGRDN